MKRYGWIIGAFVIVILLVAAETAIISNAAGYEKKVNAVYAKVHIGKNTVITSDMLETTETPAGTVHRSALKNKADAVGKRAVMEIEAGELLLQSKLKAENDALIQARNKTNRLFSVRFEGDQVNGWQLTADQRVDIIYVPSGSDPNGSGSQGENTAAGSVEQNGVRVLKNIRVAGIISDGGDLLENGQSQTAPKYVSFEVTGEQAGFLAYAKYNGKLEVSCIPDAE